MKKPTYIKAAKLALNKVNESLDDGINKLNDLRDELDVADVDVDHAVKIMRKRVDSLVSSRLLYLSMMKYKKQSELISNAEESIINNHKTSLATAKASVAEMKKALSIYETIVNNIVELDV